MARVLVIEDNPANMELSLFLLQSAGHAVLSASNAEVPGWRWPAPSSPI